MGMCTQRTWALVGMGGRGGAPRVGWELAPDLWETLFCVTVGSLPRSLAACSSACVPVSTRVLRAHQRGMHDSLATLLSWSHVFLLLTLNIYSTADRDIWCLFIICSWSLNRAINRAF